MHQEENVSTKGRVLSGVAAGFLGVHGLRHGGVLRLLMLGAAGMLGYRAFTGHCPVTSYIEKQSGGGDGRGSGGLDIDSRRGAGRSATGQGKDLLGGLEHRQDRSGAGSGSPPAGQEVPGRSTSSMG